MPDPQDFHRANTATELLRKINGTADADFARNVRQAVERVERTRKRATVLLRVSIEPLGQDKDGGLFIRAESEAKLPKLVPVGTQMHLGPAGELLTQQEIWLSGEDAPRENPQPIETPKAGSGRLPVAGAKKPIAPLAEPKSKEPLIGKDAAAGDD